MWNMKYLNILPVITGATEIITEGLRRNLEDMPGKHSIYSLQSTTVTGTSHI
jgi:hypothetical protein